MSFQDLPDDWPTRPLHDPALATDVLDLCVSDRDRLTGGLSVLCCREDATLSQPIFVANDGTEGDLAWGVEQMVSILAELPGVGGMVMAAVRPTGHVTDEDRRAHERAMSACRSHGLALWGFYLVTHAAITPLPVALELAPDAPAAAGGQEAAGAA